MGGLREFLRPPPHRGPLIAAGAVAVAVGVAVTVFRVGDTWPRAASVAILLVSGALLYWLGAQAPNEDGEPPAYQSVLVASALPLLFAGLVILGAGSEGPGPGTLLWTSAVVGALALWPAFERNSAISLLIAAILGGVVLIAASSLILDSPSRVLMAIYALALVLCGLALREPARRHAEVLIDAAGLAIAWIAAGPFYSTTSTCHSSGRSSSSAPGSGWWRSARSTARPGLRIWASRTWSCSSSSWATTTRPSGGGRSSCSPAGSRCSSPGSVHGDRCRPSPTRTAPARRRSRPAPTRARSSCESAATQGSRRARRSQSTWFCLRMIRCSIRCSSASERGSWPE